MTKLTCFLVFLTAVILCAEAVRIDPPQPTLPPGKYFPSSRITKKDDPRCKKDGIIANPDDCTRYIKCKNGESQDRKCPKGFKFDSVKRCTPDKDADCGNPRLHSSRQETLCPKDFGMFEFKEDCHKFVICQQGKPTIHTCPEHYVYDDVNGACIKGDVCPKHSAAFKCLKENGRFPHPRDCTSYFRCVNWKATEEKCPNGTAFNPVQKRCTEEWLEKCKNNDVRDIVRADE